MASILKPPGGKSIAAWIASHPRETIEGLLGDLSPNACAALPYIFDMWAIPGHQLPPDGAWRTWLILGGRGAGKTRAGAEWIRSRVEGAAPHDPGLCRRVALVGATLDEVREVMVLGESGIIACSPPDRTPVWHEGRKTLTWPNGAEARCFSAANPESLRGPQFDCAWADELAKWRKTRKTWDMLQFGLRLGAHPQQIVTTTPRANPVLEMLVADPKTMTVSAPTWANAANLAGSFLEAVEQEFGGTHLGREELEGELILEKPGALWSRALLESAAVREIPALSRVVVAVDPPATAGRAADECGIIVAGIDAAMRTAYVLADRSSQGETPQAWARRAVEAFEEFEADRIVAEVNQGGDMVEALIRQTDPSVSYRAVRATRGKVVRAEPVCALYEQGRVHHFGNLAILEDQMRAFGSECAEGSPDRVDALVWAITDLMLTGARTPRARRL